MRVFHFDLVDGTIIADAGGYPCADLAEATEIANGLAYRLARSEPQLIGKGLAIAVKSEDEEEVYRAEIDVVNRLLLSH
jgi:hypothetical protein